MDILCRFAKRFPLLAAGILDRERYKRRRIREETITDLLIAGLVPFEPLGIIADYPKNETLTGEDMDWEFVDQNAKDGRCYLRLRIQAKRAKFSDGKKVPYWFYSELDHPVAQMNPTGGSRQKLYGGQHKKLIKQAKNIPGCVPLYMFYHPKCALERAMNGLPEIEGVNWMFADKIPMKTTKGRWPVKDKKVKNWRKHFHPLSELLCFDRKEVIVPQPTGVFLALWLGGLPPGEVADRLEKLRVSEPDRSVGRAPIQGDLYT